MDADIVISLNHFKGHEATGFGGAIKNIGMGGGSRAGKMEMHHDGKPHISERKCIGCGAACGSVRMVRRSSKIKKRISIWINVLAADVVSVPVRWTR